MAQMVEHILGKDEVTGSIPVSSSKKQVLTQFRVKTCFLPAFKNNADWRILAHTRYGIKNLYPIISDRKRNGLFDQTIQSVRLINRIPRFVFFCNFA